MVKKKVGWAQGKLSPEVSTAIFIKVAISLGR
jgi:hypothetical protein